MTGTREEQMPWTVGRLLEWTARWFNEREIEGGRLAAELLLARAMDCRKIELYTRFESVPSEKQRAAFRDLVRQAGEHTPIAYLLGKREFFSLEFDVTPAVLIPRPETETIVQRVLDICKSGLGRTWSILDIGTGSGCIAIAIARYAPNATLLASDISQEALEIARRNARRHEMAERVRFIAADGPSIPPADVPRGGFDLVVSNPPYVSEQAYAALPPNVRDHEPKLALVPPGGDGLEMYRRFAADLPIVVRREGRLLVEIGHDQLQAVRSIFDRADGWGCVGTHRDPFDPHERVIELLRR